MIQAAAACWLLALPGGLFFVAGSPVGTVAQLKAPPRLAESLPEGYKLSPIHRKGVLKEGKPEFELSGYSSEEIEAEAKKIHPQYTIFSKDDQADAPKYNSTLQARQTFAINCWQPESYGLAPNWNAVWDGVNYLKSITGNCRDHPGPAACGCRVSCSWGSAIYYCNDNTVEHWEPCAGLVMLLGTLPTLAITTTPSTLVKLSWAFDQRHWNTIVGGGSC
ncbi:hypothetical protein V8F06_013368 [Rhypophila decipiens]